MIRKSQRRQQAFREQVALRYRLFDSLLRSIPTKYDQNIGPLLSIFADRCRHFDGNQSSPLELVEDFLTEYGDRYDLLMSILKVVERQVVLFDALEDAAFAEVNDLHGYGSVAHLLDKTEQCQRLHKLSSLLQCYKTRIVLTAHPTQFYPNAVLGIITDLATAIRDNRFGEIHDLLVQMARTPFVNQQKPTPREEAESVIWYLRHVFYWALPMVQTQLLEAVGSPSHAILPNLEIGFWPGGDRDGNPYVTADTTRQVAQRLRQSLRELYLDEVRFLTRRLTFKGISEQVLAIRDKLVDDSYDLPDALLVDLHTVRQQLVSRHDGMFVDKLDSLICKVNIFGFHFASMDLRQDSRIHHQICREVLADYDYESMSPETRQELLERIVRGDEQVTLPELSDRAQDCFDYIAIARQIQDQNGITAIHRYVISNTHSELDVMELLTLNVLAGWPKERLSLDIVPLFESIDDLDGAAEIMRRLYENPVYKEHLARRGWRQTIMLGFSDGTKDGGYVTANWFILLAKRKLTDMARRYGVEVIFFDGRGGPPARGGGNTHSFYRSLGSEVEHQQIHLTIQGQTISANFGTIDSARYNLEQLFTAALQPELFPGEGDGSLDEKQRQLFQEISDEAHRVYQEFRNHPQFLPYLERATPLHFTSMLNVGSRPSKRGYSQQLNLEDLRAIPFVGAWTQMKQNVLGFYGFGSALEAQRKAGNLDGLKRLYESSSFFRALVENSMQSLVKSNLSLTRHLSQEPEFAELWTMIEQEALLTEELLKEISEQSQLLEANPVIRESVRVREEIVLPSLMIQQYALTKLRREEGDKDNLTRLVVRSLAANVNASRNSV